MNFGLGVLHHHLEISAILEFSAHPFGIFFQLAGVVSFGEQIFQKDGVRYPDRLQVLHRAPKDA